jgi:membrane protein DedA with SNARE-associated domain
MESFLTHYGYAAIFLFAFLEACCVPIPSEVTFGFAGVLAGQGHLNIAAVIVVGTLAELIGSLVSYGIGRVGGRPFVARTGRYLLITHADIDRAERFFTGRGVWAVPLGRCLPVVRSFVSVVAGFVEVPVVLFGFLSLIGTAVWVTVISLVGYGVGNAWTKVNHDISLAGYGIVAIAVILIAAFVFYRLRELRREDHTAGGQDQGQGPGGAHQPKHRSPTS